MTRRTHGPLRRFRNEIFRRLTEQGFGITQQLRRSGLIDFDRANGVYSISPTGIEIVEGYDKLYREIKTEAEESLTSIMAKFEDGVKQLFEGKL